MTVKFCTTDHYKTYTNRGKNHLLLAQITRMQSLVNHRYSFDTATVVLLANRKQYHRYIYIYIYIYIYMCVYIYI
jgi:hypothetical protein